MNIKFSDRFVKKIFLCKTEILVKSICRSWFIDWFHEIIISNMRMEKREILSHSNFFPWN